MHAHSPADFIYIYICTYTYRYMYIDTYAHTYNMQIHYKCIQCIYIYNYIYIINTYTRKCMQARIQPCMCTFMCIVMAACASEILAEPNQAKRPHGRHLPIIDLWVKHVLATFRLLSDSLFTSGHTRHAADSAVLVGQKGDNMVETMSSTAFSFVVPRFSPSPPYAKDM